MTHHVYLTHPQVAINPQVPVPRWGLNDLGRARTQALARSGACAGFRRIVSSGETKAIETGEILAASLGLSVEIHENLHENDRSATGFLPPPEFEATADLFFGNPETSIRGWERAVDAQARIVSGVAAALKQAPGMPTLFVGHGGVGTLLLLHLAGQSIARIRDQPQGGGNTIGFTWNPPALLHGWVSMEDFMSARS